MTIGVPDERLLKKSVERTKLDIYVVIMRIFKFNLIQTNHFAIFLFFNIV